MKTNYEITFEKNNVYQARLCEAPSAEIARAYFIEIEPSATVCGVSPAEVVRPGQPKEIVPDGWAPAAEKSRYDIGSIMRRAWAIRKAQANARKCKVAAIPMGDCLRLAWAEAKGRGAEAHAEAVRREWAATTPEGQVDWLTRCVWRASKDLIKYSTADHYQRSAENQAYTLRGHEMTEYVDMAWIKVAEALKRVESTNAKRAEKGREPITLRSIVYNAAKAAYQQVLDHDTKYSREGEDYEINDGDGNTISVMDTVASEDNTENAAILRAELKQFSKGLDEIGRKILGMLVQYKTEREIAAEVGISNVAVHKRIAKMRAALEHLRTA